MKLILQIFTFAVVTVSSIARPLDVFFVGNQAKVTALFEEGVGKHTYVFHSIAKKEIVAPTLRIPRGIAPPPEIYASGGSYKVVAALVIDKNGKVVDVAIVETNDERLSANVKNGYLHWEFHPAKKDGKAVAICIFAPVEFEIKAQHDTSKPQADQQANK